MKRLAERDAARVKEWLAVEGTDCPAPVMVSIKRLACTAQSWPCFDSLVTATLERCRISGIVLSEELARYPLLVPRVDNIASFAPLDIEIQKLSCVQIAGSTGPARSPAHSESSALPVTVESSADVAQEIQSILRSVKRSVSSITTAISDEGGVMQDSEAIIARTMDRTRQQSLALDSLVGGRKGGVGVLERGLRRLLPATVAYSLCSYIDGIIAVLSSALWTAGILLIAVFGMFVVIWFPKN